MFSLFARGKLQHRLMEELNWRGFDFLEVAPDYTSQVALSATSWTIGTVTGRSLSAPVAVTTMMQTMWVP